MGNALLALNRLCKTFRSHWTFRPIRAVQNVSLEVLPGETFGFLGHNGAGKTTTIKCITGLLHITSGDILFDGERIKSAAYRSEIGFLPEQPYFYDHLTVEETMELFASLHGIRPPERSRRIEQTLELVHLSDRKRSSVRALSKGLQQRLGLAQAIINRPRLLLLDEPFSGLDPIGRVEVRELLLGLREQGTTIFLSSHILSDVSDICDRVAIMAHGDLKSVFELKDAPKLFGETFELTCLSPPGHSRLIEDLTAKAQSHSRKQTAQGEASIIRFADYEAGQRAMLEIASAGLRVISFESVGLSLEDIFVRITEASKQSNAGGKVETENL